MADEPRYSAVVADCPWFTPGGGRIGPHMETEGRPEDQRFPPMKDQEIVALGKFLPGMDPQAQWIAGHKIADDAHLYLWMVAGHERAAFDVAVCWGFRPVCINPWVKRGKKEIMIGTSTSYLPGPLQIGAGRYFRRCHENYLFCVRGSLMTANGAREPSVHESPRPAKDTWGSKPPSFYELVERNSPGPYLELFSRNTRTGWTMWGNEVGKRGHVG